jgi:hypothetical protein
MNFALIAAASLLAYSPASAAAPTWCSEPSVSALNYDKIKRVVEAGGPDARFLYAMPRVPADSVVLVKDERVCERAARAYYRHRLGPIPAGGVTVVRVANRYAVIGGNRAGEWTILTIYSLDFHDIAHIAS